jgi:FkbM family methyltransferase
MLFWACAFRREVRVSRKYGSVLLKHSWAIARQLARCRRLLPAPLPASLKRKILRTEILLAKQGINNNPEDNVVKMRVLDFEVDAPSLLLLMFLHREIFVDLSYFFKSKRMDPFILDCGSHIGMSILFFKALYPEAKIIGFEPHEQAYTCLETNIASNGISGVEIYRACLGLEDSMVDSFYYDPENPSSLINSKIKKRQPKKQTTVPQIRLSSFINREVDLLKLDVEGAEGEVLQDLVSSGTISKIDQMILEYHHHIDEREDGLSTFLGHLEDSGFGYQIEADSSPSIRASRGHAFQDIQLYAYRKS